MHGGLLQWRFATRMGGLGTGRVFPVTASPDDVTKEWQALQTAVQTGQPNNGGWVLGQCRQRQPGIHPPSVFPEKSFLSQQACLTVTSQQIHLSDPMLAHCCSNVCNNAPALGRFVFSEIWQIWYICTRPPHGCSHILNAGANLMNTMFFFGMHSPPRDYSWQKQIMARYLLVVSGWPGQPISE